MEDIEAEFERATEYAAKNKFPISQEDQLMLYAFFKQANVGPCNIEKPSFWDFVGKSKWNAWNNLGKMDKLSAKANYVSLISEVAPKWRDQIPKNEENKSDGSSTSSGSVTGGPVFSRIIEDQPIGEEEKDIWYYASVGDIKSLQKELDKGIDVNSIGSDGLAPIHYACDRGHIEVLKLLLARNADPNRRDDTQQTPLHYGAVCGYADIIKLLLESKADPTLCDDANATPAEQTDDPEIKALLS